MINGNTVFKPFNPRLSKETTATDKLNNPSVSTEPF
jgi:hypothetical protein